MFRNRFRSSVRAGRGGQRALPPSGRRGCVGPYGVRLANRRLQHAEAEDGWQICSCWQLELSPLKGLVSDAPARGLVLLHSGGVFPPGELLRVYDVSITLCVPALGTLRAL